jgi:hypothetical protein
MGTRPSHKKGVVSALQMPQNHAALTIEKRHVAVKFQKAASYSPRGDLQPPARLVAKPK